MANSSTKTKRLILAVAVILATGLATVLYLLTSSPSNSPSIQFTSPEERDSVALGLQQKLQTLKSDGRVAGQSSTVEMSEHEVNALIQSPAIESRLREKQISDLSVRFRQGKVSVTGLVAFHGMNIPLTVTGTVVDSGQGSVTFQADDVRIGKIGAPQSVTAEIAKKVDEAVRSGQMQLPGKITQVRVDDGKIYVTELRPGS